MIARKGSTINGARFSSDASRILMVNNTGYSVTVWNIGHDHREHEFKYECQVSPAKFSPDGHELLTIIPESYTVLLQRIDDNSFYMAHLPAQGAVGIFYTGWQRAGAQGLLWGTGVGYSF